MCIFFILVHIGASGEKPKSAGSNIMKYIEDNQFNQKIYLEIGEEFELIRNNETIKLKCVEETDPVLFCRGCVFCHESESGCKGDAQTFPFACDFAARPDGKDVIFVESK